MSSARRAAGLAGALFGAVLAAGATQTLACELVLSEHRSDRELRRLPLDAADPQLRIAFEHSVLGTTVVDRYRFGPRPVLVEERFSGEGYGLPYAAGPGEQMRRDGEGWVLTLQRAVDPLVVRPLPAQRMRLVLADGALLHLAELGATAVAMQAQGCAGPAVAAAR